MSESMSKQILSTPRDPRIVLGDLVTILLTGKETGGEYSVVEISSVPGGGPSFLHTHPAAETFYIISGKFEIYGQSPTGEKYAIPASAGKTVHVPGDTPHGFANVGTELATLLAIYEPAGNMELFHAEVGMPVEDPENVNFPDEPPDLNKLMPVFEKYGIVLIERPGA
ncbi:MAG: cupin domain-containing protein [Anaerolineales bacterium]|nr:cupin domain-containing protein [Anaerolineales bacterium]